MNPDFWLERWRAGRIGWHSERVMPLLAEHWPTLGLPRGARVLVPLAGKSLDMIWLAAQGYSVLGVELSPIAVEQFFSENRLEPVARDAPEGRHFTAERIEIICSDVMTLDAAVLAGCSGVYDRAALIALPPAMRRRYAERLYGRLPRDGRGMLITLEYPQDQREGPPFSVDEEEVRELLDAQWDVELLERRDILASEPQFASQGITALNTAVYRLRGRPEREAQRL
jgi:thiopurine S-methyltransferase